MSVSNVFNVRTGTGTADENIYFIPDEDLATYGLSQANLENSNDRIKEGEICLALFKALIDNISPTSYLVTPAVGNILGLTATATDSVVSTGISTRLFSFTNTYLLNLATNLISPITLNNLNSGKLSFTDIFPNISKVASGENVSAGVGLSASVINTYGGRAYANVSVANDVRQEICAILNALRATLTVRNTSGSITSAITSITRTDAQTVALQTPSIPSTAYGTSPSTGIVANDLSNLMLLNYTRTFTIERAELPDDSLIVNVA